MTPLFALLMALASPTDLPDGSCSPGPLPPALDALAPLDSGRKIAFSATPSLEYPGRAWVVRVAQKVYSGPATVEIVRLRRQEDCNRYDVEQSWQASIPEERFDALLAAVTPLATPPADQFSRHDPMRSLEEIGIDGTLIMLRLTDLSWETTRRVHHSGKAGTVVSSLFHSLVSEHVPASELPTREWGSIRHSSGDNPPEASGAQ